MIKASFPVLLLVFETSHNSTRTHNAEVISKVVKYMDVRLQLDFACQSQPHTYLALSPNVQIALQYAKVEKIGLELFVCDDIYLGGGGGGGCWRCGGGGGFSCCLCPSTRVQNISESKHLLHLLCKIEQVYKVCSFNWKTSPPAYLGEH